MAESLSRDLLACWLEPWRAFGYVPRAFKRIDRVFPVVAPLCLLLAVEVGEFRSREGLTRLTEAVCNVAIALACVFTSVYAVQRMFVGYRGKTDAFERFGYLVRKEAAIRGLKYKIVGGEDEGMLLYVEQTEFIEPEQAAIEWENGAVNSLVVADDELAELLPRLPGATPLPGGTSGPAGRYQKRYVFLVHEGME